MLMKIVTWNMNYWQKRKKHEEAWRYLVNVIQPDIALLQETQPPDSYRGDGLLFEPFSQYNWGSAIYARGLSVEYVPIETYKGYVIVGNIALPKGKPLTTISLQSPIVDTYSITELHRIFSDLTRLLDRKRSYKLVGGDFNAGLLFDEVWNIRTHKVMFDRVEAFGLTNCHRRFHEKEEQTFRRKGARPYQLDHMFISDKLADGLVSCDVLYNGEIEALSDHNPLVTVLEI